MSITAGADSTLAGLVDASISASDKHVGTVTINVTGSLTVGNGAAAADINAEGLSGGCTAGFLPGSVNVTTSVDFTMNNLATLSADGNACRGGTININAGRDALFHSGSLLTAIQNTNADGQSGGFINITAGRNVVQDQGSTFTVSAQKPAGDITILAPNGFITLNGEVLANSDQSGSGAAQGGGKITVIAGCALDVGGLVSSLGQDPGADLVHLEGCDVTISGTVRSGGVGHSNPANVCRDDVKPDNPTGCIEVWAHGTLTITGTAELNADLSAPAGNRPWIDLFANKDILINSTAPNGAFSVHANTGGSNKAGDVTVKSITGKVTTAGNALSASAIANGGDGGNVVVQSGGAGSPAGDVAHGSSQIWARGAAVGNGVGIGGTISTRSFNGGITGAAGGLLTTAAFSGAGTVNLQSCIAQTYTPPATVTGTLNTSGGCGSAPTLPAYVGVEGSLPGCTVCAGSKSGVKFDDLNGNGTREQGEPGLENWPINLYKQNGQNFDFVQTKNTDATGAYTFSPLDAGVYRVCEGNGPAGYIQTRPFNGMTPPAGETVTNLCPASNIYGYQFTIEPGTNLQGNDFGNFKQVTKSGVKFNDLDGDGAARENGEPGIQNWPINLYKLVNGNFVLQAPPSPVLTDVNGAYSFPNLGPGTYRVCEGAGPAGWVQTYPNAGTPNPTGETITSLCPASNIYGYEFTTVSGQNISGNDFGNFKLVTKSGVKFDDKDGDGAAREGGEPGVADWPINLYKDVQGTFVLQAPPSPVLTDANGAYSFPNLGPGTYRVCEGAGPAGYIQTYPNANTPNPTGETITNLCPADNIYGYQFTTSSGTNISGNDFGNFKKPNKDGVKFNDLDGDGAAREGGEPGIADWPINIYKLVNGNYVLQDPPSPVLTGGNGFYDFPNLDPGTYRVCEGAGPAGWIQTYPNANTPNPTGETITSLCPGANTFGYQFTTSSGTNITGNDFGNFKLVTKSGVKFNDLDGDGAAREGGEPGVADWPINLYKDVQGTFVLQAPPSPVLTDGNGAYSFPNLGPGTYRVCEGAGPAGWIQTYPNAGTPNPTGETITNLCPASNTFGYQFTTSSGTNITGNDFGNFKLVTKSGVKFDDLDGDGAAREGGEPGVANWPINLYKLVNGNYVLQAPPSPVSTDGNGAYSFPNLGPGTYRVCEGVVAGWIQTYPNAGTPNPTGETITALCPASNIYGYQFTTSSGTNITGNDFGNFKLVTKSGVKFNDLDGDGAAREGGEPGVADWPINLFKLVNGNYALQEPPSPVLTDGNGAYSFPNLGPGSYRVCEGVVAGWVQTYPNAGTPNPTGETITNQCLGQNSFGYQFTTSSGTNITGNDFGNFKLVTKSGVKFNDLDGDGAAREGGEPGVADWPINLFKLVNGNFMLQEPPSPVNTDGNGAYSFPNLGPGTYRVCEGVVAGWVQTYPNAGTPNPTGETITNQCLGQNSFGYQFTTSSGTNITGNDFGNFKLVTKSGVKFEDVDGDGAAREGGEPGIAGWPINLFKLVNGNYVLQDPPSPVNTGAGGAYSFPNLGPGTYRVCEGVVAGYEQTYPNAGTPNPTGETITNQCLGQNPFGYQFTTSSGTNLSSNDFGNFNLVTKSGVKFHDLDGDGGPKGVNDPAVNGWTINLYKQSGQSFNFVTSTTTGPGGAYSFPNLGPGTYRVCEGSVQGWTQSYPNAQTQGHQGETVTSACAAPNNFGWQFTTSSGTDLTLNDFGNFQPAHKSGTKFNDLDGDGLVREPGEPGVGGWPINLYKDVNGTFTLQTTVNTAADGSYSFPTLPPGTYRVCEGVQSGWVQTFPNFSNANPPNELVTDDCPAPNTFGYQFTAESGDDFTGNDFGNFEMPTKSGLKFEDTNGSGARDPGEPVIPDWPINLYKQVLGTFEFQSTVNTAADGTYSFGPLGVGTYRVCEGDGLAGFVQSFPNASTPDPANETITDQCPGNNPFGYQFTTVSGVDLEGNNFGNLPPEALNTLTIIKKATPQGPATFSFSASGGLTPSTFVLDDDGDNQNTHSNRQVFQDIVPGSYTIVETPTDGFQLNAIDCTGATHVVDLPNHQVQITAAEGDAIVCTFTNIAVEVGGVTTGTSSALAFTGSNTSSMIVAAIASLLVGAMLVIVARRRRKGFEV